MLALLLSYILLLVCYYEDITLPGNVDNFSFLNKITITKQLNLLVIGLHVTYQ